MESLTTNLTISLADFLKILSLIFTAFTVLLARKSLIENTQWNRNQFASQLLANWSEQTLKHREAIESYKPGIIDFLDQNDLQHALSEEEAEAIYSSRPHQKQLWNLRFHITQILNYFELIASAYHNNIADPKIVDHSFIPAMQHYHKVLGNFIKVVEKHRGFNPWEPYTHLIIKS